MGTSLVNLAADNLPARDTENETAVSAAASQAKAAVEARYMVAIHRPRNMDNVRVRVLEACKRPRFAETARYAKPVGGKKIIGPSVRFAEEVARCFGNLLVETPTLYDDDDKRIVGVTVTDLETNLSYSGSLTLSKTVERLHLKDGQVALSERMNSEGKITYTVAATEDDLLNKQNAGISKQMRNNILRILPGDILEEAMEQVVVTLRDDDAKDPAAARKKIVDAFFAVGVGPNQLVDYLGHQLEQISPVQLVELRTIYSAVKDQEVSWSDVMDQKKSNGEGSKRGAAGLKDRVTAKAGKAEKKDEEMTDAESLALDAAEAAKQ